MTDDLSALSELYIYAAFAGYVIYATLAICMTFFGHFALLTNALAYCRRTHKGEIQWLYQASPIPRICCKKISM
jgi:hypothetical protein